MTQRGKKASGRGRWNEGVISPVLQQILALLTLAAGVITLLALLGVTAGRWTDAVVNLLRYLLGWGAYPTAVAVAFAGLLWLQFHLDRAILWRWRPFVGVEVVFLSLLPLTHLIVSRGDLWGQVETGWGGGLVGWALSAQLVAYLGVPAAVTVLVLFLGLGLALVLDVTAADIKQIIGAVAAHTELEKKPTRGVAASRRSASDGERFPRSPVSRVSRRQIASARRVPGRVARDVKPRVSKPTAEDILAGEALRSPAVAAAKSAAASMEQPALSESEGQQQSIEYVLPSMDMLAMPGQPALSDEEVRSKSRIIAKTLAQFGLPVEVAEVRVGPTITQFGIKPGFVPRSGSATGRKVRVNQIAALADDLALALAAPRLRVEAPVPGRSVVGIEVPNSQIQIVGVREVMDTEEFEGLAAPLAFAVGRDVAGAPVVADLAKMPHLLIAGTTGSGKSVCIKAITACLIMNNTPDQLRLVMIDPKRVELIGFNGLPHLLGRVEVDLKRVVNVLRWVAQEMDSRYRQFAGAAARNLDDYNGLMEETGGSPLPRIVVLVDEMADLMMLAPDEVEKLVCRIAQMARATGIHLVLATQRPSVDVVTGLIKANFPARISFATASQTDSRVILDMQGAETLLGKGDMLYLASDAGHPVRVQGCYVSGEELEGLVRFWRGQAGSFEEPAPWEHMISGSDAVGGSGIDGSVDDLLQEAIALVRESGSEDWSSTSCSLDGGNGGTWSHRSS